MDSALSNPYALCAVTADLARYEREQDRKQESETVLANIEEEVSGRAVQDVIWSPTLLSKYFTESFSFDDMSGDERKRLLENLVLIWMDDSAESVCRRLKQLFTPHIQAAADRYTRDETERIHNEWLRERGRK